MRLALLLSVAALCGFSGSAAAAAVPLELALLSTPQTSGSAAVLSVRAPLGLNLEVPPLLKVEASPQPRVEVPGVAKVELPSVPRIEVPKVEVPAIPKLEAPATPPVQTPSAPTSSTPVTSPSHPSAPTEAPTSTGGGGKASAATSGPGGAGSPPAGSGWPTTPSAGGQGSASAAPRSQGRSRARSHPLLRRSAQAAVAAGPSKALLLASATPGASSKPRRSHATAAASNPLDALGRQIPFPVPVPDWSKPIILLLALVALGLGIRSRLASLRARRLERQRAALLRDVGVMQATLVPVIPERLGDLAVSVAYRPADGPAAGGDFYDLFVLESGKVAVILGDVAGHGHSALTQAALTRYTLRAYIQAGLEPRSAIALAGSVLADAAAAHYATVLVGLYDASSATFTYASAGHPPPIAVGCEAPEPLTLCCSPPVGWDVPTGRRQTTISLPVGARVCLFSDGLLEARAQEGLIGHERLGEIIAELGPRAGAAGLLDRVRAEAEATPDDMVACIIAPQAGVARPPVHVEEIEVDADALERDETRQFLAACHLPVTKVARAIAVGREIVGESGTALLRIERSTGAPATVTVVPGFGNPAPVPTGGAPADEKALLRALAGAG